MATPAFNYETLQGVAVAQLQSKTTYTVLDGAATAAVCNPPTSVGSFTTQ
jgi:hypothetical protein